MSTIRRDGTWMFYQVEFQDRKYDNDPTNQYAGWNTVGMDGRGYIATKYPFRETAYKDRPICIEGMGASGQCWQKTGNDGHMEEQLGIDLLLFMREYSDLEKYRFRLVKRTIFRSTETIMNIP